MEIINIEERGKAFADSIIEAVEISGAQTQLKTPTEAFESGVYFGIVQGYKRGVNEAVNEIVESLPDIFNMISESNFDMTKDWKEIYRKMILRDHFGIEI